MAAHRTATGGSSQPHPFFARCVHGVQFLNACDHCPDGCPVISDPVDEAIDAAGWVNHDGPRPYKHVAAQRTGGKFAWELRDNSVSPHLVVTSGRAWTRAGGRRLVHRAHLAELAARATEASGIRDRRQDGLGCE